MDSAPADLAAAPISQRARSSRGPEIHPLTLIIGILVVVLTAALTWAASTVNHNSNQRLLTLQVRQTAAAISGSVSSVQSQLLDALQVATATNSPAAFRTFAGARVGSRGGFYTLSLWERSPSGTHRVALAGPVSRFMSNGQAAAFFSQVRPTDKLQVTGILSGNPPHLGYAEMAPGDTRYIVYAEGVLPPHQKLVVPKSSAFSDLNFALYLGKSARASQLIEASVPTPIRGQSAASSLPFGDTSITVVATPTTQLAGGLSGALPWIALGIGIVLALVSTIALEYVLRRRGLAERLATENEDLYFEQRNIAGILQRALLPEVPEMEAIEAAARYLPGTVGVDVGGDWFDIVNPDKTRCVVVVGDVSGRGLHAATTMAALRYATKAYVAEGFAPEVVLRKLGMMISFDAQQQFATMLIGQVDVEARQVTLACAGHLPPLLVSAEGARFIDLPIATPVGVDPASVSSVTVDVPQGATMFAFTDGLVERRGEHLDVGLDRLKATIEGQSGTVEEMLDQLVSQLIPGGSEDDVVIVGFRWRN